MAYVPLEKLVTDKHNSLYKLVLAVAARANELAQGATPLVHSASKKVSTLALEEFAAGKVRYEEIKGKSKKASS